MWGAEALPSIPFGSACVLLLHHGTSVTSIVSASVLCGKLVVPPSRSHNFSWRLRPRRRCYVGGRR